MGKKKHKRKSIDSEQNLLKSKSDVNVKSGSYIFFIVLIIIFNILLIRKITSNNIFIYFHTSLQLISYLLIYNLSFILFYNFNYKILKKRTSKIFYILLGFSIFYVYLISFYPVLELNGDNAAYLSRAKSLILGKGFRNLWLPKEPYESTLKGIGFSILNIPFILLFGFNNYVGLKLLELLSIFAGIFFMYKYFQDKLEKDLLFLLGITVIIYSQIIHFSSIIMTESVSFFFLFLTLYLSEQILKEKIVLNYKGILKLFLLGFLIFCTFTVREAMIAIVIAILFYLLINRKWKEGFFILLAIFIFFSLYFAYSYYLKNLNVRFNLIPNVNAMSNEMERQSFLSYYLKVFLKKGFHISSFWKALLVISQKVVGNPDIPKYSFILGNIVVLLIIGIAFLFKIKYNEKLNLYDIFSIILIFVVVIFWGTPVDVVVFSRYFYPLIPFIFYYFIKGINYILLYFNVKKEYIKFVYVIVFSFITIFLFKENLLEVYIAKHPYQPSVKNFIEACKWIKNNTNPDSIIATRKSTLSYIWAERKSMHYFDTSKYTRYDKFSQQFESDTLSYYNQNNIKYIILDAFSYDAYYKILPIVKKHRDKFRPLYKTAKPETYVLEVKL